MPSSQSLRIQKAAAQRALTGIRGHAVGIGPVDRELGLVVRVNPGDAKKAKRLLHRARLDAPIEVVEVDYQPRGSKRRRNGPTHEARIHNFLGGAKIKDIHPPPDPWLSVLDAEARAFWDAVYEDAYAYYRSAGAPKPKQVAERTAWRAVRLHWDGGYEGIWQPSELEWPEAVYLPSPEDLIVLGKLLEYSWLREDGTLEVRKWNKEPPNLYWNHQQKTLYAFPNLPDKDMCLPIDEDLVDLAELYEVWAQRKAECQQNFEVDADLVLEPMGYGDGVAYRSDKWHIKNSTPSLTGSQEYFHQFMDVWIWQDQDPSPNAILISGGDLDVEEHGIIK